MWAIRASSAWTITSDSPTDPLVATSLVSTFKFALIVIPVTMFASLAFALLLNHPRLALKGPLRTLVYMPIMIPLVASTLVWTGFLNTETGWLNKFISSFGVTAPDWFNSEVWVYPALDTDGAVGDRQLHDHQHRRPPVCADRAIRGRQDRWSGLVDVLATGDHPVDVPGPAVQPGHRP